MLSSKTVHPIPILGCLVRRTDGPLGIIRERRQSNGVDEVLVQWDPSGRIEWVKVREVHSGYGRGAEVDFAPNDLTRQAQRGVVKDTRIIGGRQQHLVDFLEHGALRWVAFEHLRIVRGVASAFEKGATDPDGAAERFRLQNLAYALESWHENTGALSHLAIDPLPHQIHLVHHILKSGHLNWLIADDVGLGKTIEVGMLLSALTAMRDRLRVLLVSPAGLTRQWKEELHSKFRLSSYQVYGDDFAINDNRDWSLHDYVIASIDLLKQKDHLETLKQAEPWDVVVFDEAHRLGRSQYGMKFDTSDRYRLAKHLRRRTGSMLLLSATPHQGKPDKFEALLELIRPEWTSKIRTLSLNPELLTEMVLRNHKADVTDADGDFLFKGKVVSTIDVPLGPQEAAFEDSLRHYLAEGYAASSRARELRQRDAIGLVMSVYRKLAASSVAAIISALSKRLQQLTDAKRRALVLPRAADEDSPFEAEADEQVGTSEPEFFDGEIGMLRDLLSSAEQLHGHDRKLAALVDGIASRMLRSDPSHKILVFTEYRASQSYIANALRARFGADCVSLLHGEMDARERAGEIARFETDRQFLVSTEAGGEGINLQRRCHVMVNFDLPWNPMRLVQRIGRLYRYGQKKQVFVFNMKAAQTLDAQIVQILYDRIEAVVSAMHPLGGDFRSGLEQDILGELVDLLDVEGVLSEARSIDVRRTQERIDEALRRARASVEKQRAIFSYFARFDPAHGQGAIKLSMDHVRSFVVGMCRNASTGMEVVEGREGALTIRLSESAREHLGVRSATLQVTFDRDMAGANPQVQMMDFDSALLRYLIERAKHFDTPTAQTTGIDGDALLTAVLRWQSDDGRRIRQEFATVVRRSDGTWETNADDVVKWLLVPARDEASAVASSDTKSTLQAAKERFDARLAELSSASLQPENLQLIGAVRICAGAT